MLEKYYIVCLVLWFAICAFIGYLLARIENRRRKKLANIYKNIAKEARKTAKIYEDLLEDTKKS